ncbi:MULTISPECIES: sce7725 family protein [Clostridium]|uniref:Uncharacterized protein n=2 Tax=Clostridium butyricum TaxID=1492 RepID=A0A6M5I689_CLOBU|nr:MULTISPECIES: sce7725 family protein [Clostridium]KIU09224.1 hypothetical protein SC08_Contig83orf03302 [Clostridium butyricum]MBA8965550.1 hypothetical protein [Clostridium butyricum]MBA8969893.1 hypothetical protein [Clostridium butyricum]MBC2428253.1 sce7725 family protein [Clostridium butyricum]MDU1068581.1 sce7725 family protein [Clostridium sp.]
MYLPYLRGRQFELLALRELVEKNLISTKIMPIIEPIKPTPTLIKTLQTYVNNHQNLAIIMNPNVGNFTREINAIKNTNKETTILKPLSECIKQHNIAKAYIMNKKISDKIKNNPEKDKFIIINNKRDDLSYYKQAYEEENPVFSLIPDDRTFRRNIENGKILLDDKFKKQERNVDYIETEDEFFSDDHKFFHNEGYEGFSDYSIVGKEFKESGFAPLAVAIHIVYFDEERNLRIKHFVSDSNEDISDPAGKFGEALTKLISWISEGTIITEALKQFRECFETGKYPGLGTVKKLCVMHHIELVSKFLDGEI